MKSTLLAVILVAVLLIPHLFYLGNGYVDKEPVYAGLAADIADGNDIGWYFEQVSNPILTSLYLAVPFAIFGEGVEVARLSVLLLGAASVMFVFFYLRRKEGQTFAFITSLLVAANSLFMVYSQEVVTDVPFMAFASVGMLLLAYSESRSEFFWSAVSIGLALATKYIIAVLFPVALYLIFRKEGFSRDELLHSAWSSVAYFLVVLAVSLPIVLIGPLAYGNLLPTGASGYLTNLTLTFFVSHVLGYLMWLGLFLGPLSLLVLYQLWKRLRVKAVWAAFALGLLTLLLTFIAPVSSLNTQEAYYGEMNIGWVDSAVPQPYLSIALFLVIIASEMFLLYVALESGRLRGVWAWIAVPLLLMSFTRAANRYMLALLVPIAMYTAHVVVSQKAGRDRAIAIALVALHVAMFLAVGVYSNHYLLLRGAT